MLGPEKFCYLTFWWENLTTDDAVKAVVDGIADIGYRAIEWKETSFHPEKPRPEELERFLGITQDAGLAVPDWVILKNILDPQGLADILAFIEAVGTCPVRLLNLVTAGQPEGWTYDRAWDALTEAYLRVAEACEKHDVTIAMEAVVGQLCHDYFTTKELIDRIAGAPASERICLTFDPSHYAVHRCNIPWSVRQWGSKIKHVHMKDGIGPFGVGNYDWHFPLLGDGLVPWSDFFAALEEVGYDGYLSVEYEMWGYMENVLHNDYFEAARLSFKSLKGLWETYKGP